MSVHHPVHLMNAEQHPVAFGPRLGSIRPGPVRGPSGPCTNTIDVYCFINIVSVLDKLLLSNHALAAKQRRTTKITCPNDDCAVDTSTENGG